MLFRSNSPQILFSSPPPNTYLGNKKDLEASRVVSEEELQAFGEGKCKWFQLQYSNGDFLITANGVEVMETSAKMNENINEAIYRLTALAMG